jgi:hypothetical protein
MTPLRRIQIKTEEKEKPRIMVSPVYDRSELNLRKRFGGVDPTKILKVRTVEIEPGLVIERGGVKYTVDAKGTQRRVKQ